jgi:hypothetical protein
MKHPPYWQSPVFGYVVLVSLSILLTRFFHLVLLNWLTLFLLPLFWLLLLGLVAIGLIWSIGFYLSAAPIGQHRGGRSVPLMLQIAIVPIALGLPLEQLWLTYNFHRYLPARQQVVELIETNRLGSGMFALPDVYRATSMGGREVQVLSWQGNSYVLFFTMQIFGGAAGFIYSENDIPPPDALFAGYQMVQKRPIQPHWYYIQIGD